GERVWPGFTLGPENQAALVRICQLVDGLPLALELAASWLRTLSPGDIAAEIERSLDFLQAQTQDRPDRHRSLRALLESTWRMLSSQEQETFRRLAVFQDGFTAEAARRVAGATLPRLSRLVDQSLLWRDSSGRYHRHPLLHRFAWQNLAMDAALADACRDQHCRYYAALLDELAGQLATSQRVAAVARLEAEIENVRVAWQWAVARARADWLDSLAEGYGQYLVDSGLFLEGRAAFVQANAALQEDEHISPVTAARLLTWQAIFERTVGAVQRAEALLRRALGLLDDPGLANEDTRRERARALEELAAHFLHEKGEYEAAQALYEQALALYTELADEWGMSAVYNSLGVLAYYVGDYATAQQRNQESLRLRRKNGQRSGLIRPLQTLGMVAVSQGRFTEGVGHFQEALAYAREEKHLTHLPWLLADLGYAHLLSGAFDQAQSTLAEGLQMGQQRQEAQIVSVLDTLLGFVHLHRGAYADAEEQGARGLATAADKRFRFEHAFAQLLLGSVALVEEEWAQAEALFSAAAQTYREIGHVEYLAWALPLLACGACKQGQ
ncbi:MAG: hypothetical protein D6790_10110, partial [Caldilineae bacterium]